MVVLRRILLVLVASLLPVMDGAWAVSPEEQLSDPVLEGRAREISAELRCLVCQNQSIDDSEAPLARDLRLEVRRLLTEGADNQAVFDSIQAKYGDFVLLNPPIKDETLLLWLSPILVLLIGGLIVLHYFRAHRRHGAVEPASVTTEAAPVEPPTTPQTQTGLLTIGLLLGVVVFAAIGLYVWLGRPDLPMQPLEARQAEIAASQSEAKALRQRQQQAIAGALRQAEANPDLPNHWLALAELASQADDHTAERRALTELRRLQPDNPDWLAAEAGLISRMADDQITLPARVLLQQALAQDPSNARARYLMGVAAYQDGDHAGAMTRWQTLLEEGGIDSPWRVILVDNIRRAAEEGGLELPDSVADLARPAIDPAMMADASPEERNAMIAEMVEGLAERLKEEPDNLAGWQRLARAREVMDNFEGMLEALFQVARLQPDHWKAQVAPLERLLSEGRSSDYAADAEAVLTRMATIRPEGMAYLFFAGHYAKIGGETSKARGFWERLLEQMPADEPAARELRKQLAALG